MVTIEYLRLTWHGKCHYAQILCISGFHVSQLPQRWDLYPWRARLTIKLTYNLHSQEGMSQVAQDMPTSLFASFTQSHRYIRWCFSSLSFTSIHRSRVVDSLQCCSKELLFISNVQILTLMPCMHDYSSQILLRWTQGKLIQLQVLII